LEAAASNGETTPLTYWEKVDIDQSNHQPTIKELKNVKK